MTWIKIMPWWAWALAIIVLVVLVVFLLGLPAETSSYVGPAKKIS